MKKFLKNLFIVCLLIASFGIFTQGCAKNESAEKSVKETQAPENEAAKKEIKKDKKPVEEEKEPDLKQIIRIVMLKGPTAMGAVYLGEDAESPVMYDVSLAQGAQEIGPMFAKDQVDIAMMPANMAAAIFNKTDGSVRVLNINTLGVLYIVDKENSQLKSIADLKGKTILATGKGAVPEFVLRGLIKKSGLDPEKDVTIDFKSEPAEIVQALSKGQDAVAMLPEPFVTAALSKAKGLKVVMSLGDEWEKAFKSPLVTGVCVVSSAFAEQYPSSIDTFLKEYSSSIEKVNANPDDAAKKIGELGIVPEEVAKKAIKKCSLKFISGGEMKDVLSKYLKELEGSDPQSIGGKMPSDFFYYIKK